MIQLSQMFIRLKKNLKITNMIMLFNTESENIFLQV